MSRPKPTEFRDSTNASRTCSRKRRPAGSDYCPRLTSIKPKATALAVAIKNLEAHDVNVRILGAVALIHARTTCVKPDGQPGAGRYTYVWARRGSRWLAVSAHDTCC